VKIIEFTHLFTILTEFNSRRQAPDNPLGHEWKHFTETMLHTTINHFITFTDPHKDGLHIQHVWSVLFPQHRRAIERYWNCGIEDGWRLIRKYRDNAGSHSGHLEKFLEARGALMANRRIVLKAINSFLKLAICLMRRESEELAEFPDFIESTLLDIELRRSGPSFNRRWLRDWKLLESGRFSKKYI
jgi:hypothetical protein